MTTKNTDDILRALLDTELKPTKAVPMKRFGIDFTIQALDGKTINKMREQATIPVRGGTKQLDDEKFNALIITQGCLVPDWSDRALFESFGPTPEDAIQKRLLAGELAKLSSEILDLSGFGDDEAEIDAVKN